ncbi:MAG TPA: hypothetical protein VKX33_13970 [Cyclobacteriaceae bacterium]|nr:hypothetical protein [Cyclobacteriaceae bacterium]
MEGNYMERKKSIGLIKRLINNQISREELDTLLEGLDDDEASKVYEIYLRDHFDKIMEENVENLRRKKEKNR